MAMGKKRRENGPRHDDFWFSYFGILFYVPAFKMKPPGGDKNMDD
ncbi:hypothetical protein UNDYM_3640 [Undibacterium sp. YM2]|nr:hypothetical protein UNDYM_3640 [Undibacterium sp. YM2]